MNPPPPPGSPEEVAAAAQVPLPESRSRSRSPSPTIRSVMAMLTSMILRTSVLEGTVAAQLAASAASTYPAASKPEPPPPPPPATAEPIDDAYGSYPFPPGTPAPPLDKLDGETPSKVAAWLHTARTWLTCYTRISLSTPASVNYIGTFFLVGRAAQWWQACCAAAANTPLAFSGGFSCFSTFHTALIHALGVPFPQDQARKDLDAIKQTSTVSTYAARFQSIVAHLPVSESANHLYAFIRGLKPELQASLAGKINNMTDTWHTAYTLASTFENSPLYRPSPPSRPPPRSQSPAPRLAAISSSSAPPRRGRSPTPCPANSSSTNKPKLAPITDEERAYLIANNGCFRCRQLGHLGYQCETYTSTRPAGPSRGTSPSNTAPKN